MMTCVLCGETVDNTTTGCEISATGNLLGEAGKEIDWIIGGTMNSGGVSEGILRSLSLGDLIATGSFSQVYAVSGPGGAKWVAKAMKICDPDGGKRCRSTMVRKEQLASEAAAQARAAQKGLALNVHAAWIDVAAGKGYIMMDFMNGILLQDIINAKTSTEGTVLEPGKFPASVACKKDYSGPGVKAINGRLAEVDFDKVEVLIKALMKEDLVIMDFHPGQVFIETSTNQAKLLDFGLAGPYTPCCFVDYVKFVQFGCCDDVNCASTPEGLVPLVEASQDWCFEDDCKGLRSPAEKQKFADSQCPTTVHVDGLPLLRGCNA